MSNLDGSIAPGPRDAFLSRMIADPLMTLDELHADYGDVVRFNLGEVCHAFYDPTHVQYIMQDHHGSFLRTTAFYDSMRSVMGDGLLASNGPFWLRQRRIVQPNFSRQKLSQFGGIMVEAAQWTADRWAGYAATGEPFDLLSEFTKLTLRVLGNSLFGADLSSEAEVLSEAIWNFSRQTGNRSTAMAYAAYAPDVPVNAEILAARSVIQELAGKLIADRRADRDRGDLLSVLIRSVDTDTGQSMTEEELAAEVMHLVTAGHETTGAAFCFTFHLLSQHPAEAELVRQEANAVFGDRLPTLEDLGKLHYTRAVVQESLRLYPPVWSQTRRCETEDVVGDFLIPRGSLMIMAMYQVHRRADLWPDPDAFKPERFLGPQPERHRYAFFPFGHGPHQCVGNHFALMELVLCTSVLLQRYRIAGVPGPTLPLQAAVALQPKHDLLVSIEAAK